MSTSLANINHTAVLLNASTTPQTQLLSFHPNKVLIQNSGTVPVYVRAAQSASPISITLPVAGTEGSWSEVLPGAASTLTWSTTQTTKYLEYVASGACPFTVKLTSGK